MLNKRYVDLIEDLKKNHREVESEVIEAYKLILNDPEILSRCEQLDPKDIINIYDVFSSSAKMLESLEDDYFKQRSEDIR